ncbi:hypothetical protein C8J27_11063 [Rhodobacter aestuarii]|uniref:Phage tail protein n=1 Tax=Rhodobacter aestuarii TaxID=453582 RepID=A0A1N7Q1J8_9RHOB|nr:hypothetical protein [Rhodobacter aestuarii]PTV94012.1 hypothetical protein C8J27_11063 [Rhodobacter aestuarii]SIT16539.1 hypothetical protein SAMN05421580_11263 [Rhodobacter aestuarii]
MLKHDHILCAYRSPFGITPQVHWARPGITLDEAIDGFKPALPPEFRRYGVICLNGHPVPRKNWHRVRPKSPSPGRPVELSFSLPPRGGDGGGKKVFAFIASIALSLATGWVLAGNMASKWGLAAFKAGSAAAFAAAAGIQVVGALLITALSPSPKSDNQSDRWRNEGTASLRGNVLDPNGAIPRVLGERKIFPPLGTEPLTYFDGADEIVEAAYVLAGPHRLTDIRIGAASAYDTPGVEIETREGWPGDRPLWLLRRQSRTEAPQAELTPHQVDSEDASLLDPTLDLSLTVPQPQVLATWDKPDEHQVQMIFAQGLNFEGGSTKLRVPVRIRMRQRGTTAWRNLPELHFQGASLRQMRSTIRLVWTEEAATPAAATSEGWVEARRNCPDQAVSPAEGGWTADDAFGAAGDAWMDASNLGTTGVTGVTLDRYTATIHLDPALWPPGRWEIEITRGAVFTQASYSAAAYTVNGSVWALFGYRDPATPRIAMSRNMIADALILLRSVSIWNETPIVPGDMAIVAIRARNKQLDRVSVVAGGWVPDWDGEAWRDWAVTDNPAPHLRDIYAGRLNADALPAELVDTAGLVAWRDECSAKDWRVNAVIEDQGAAAAAAIVASCGYGQPYASEIWGVVVDRDTSEEAPVQLFTPRNSAEFSWRRAMPRLPDGLRVNFRDAAIDYEARQITVLRPGGSPRGVLEQVDYEGLVTEDEVRARARYDLAQPRHRGTYYSLTAPAEAIVCRRGSLVAVQHDQIERHGATARVATVWLNTEGLVAALDLEADVPLISRPSWAAIADLSTVGDVSLIGALSAALVRRADGSSTIHPLIGDGDSDKIVFATPANPDGIKEGTLVSVGLHGRETLRCKVLDIEPRDDLQATLTLVDEANEVHHDG